MRLKNQRFETFNDGVLDVCGISNRTITATKITAARFGNKTVGEKRFWDAQVSGTTVNRMVCVPYAPGIERADIVLIGDEQYKILQVQEKFDASPPCLYLSLANDPIAYRDERTQ